MHCIFTIFVSVSKEDGRSDSFTLIAINTEEIRTCLRVVAFTVRAVKNSTLFVRTS